MHTTVDTEALKNILEIASRVSTKHITLPILQCVRIEVAQNVVTIKATNLEIGVEGRIAVSGATDGVVAVPAQVLLQTINYITDKTVTLALNDTTLTIQTKSSKTNIKAFPVDEFPHIPRLTNNKQHMKGSLFALGIKTAAFAASQSSIKPELGSIYIAQKKAHTLTFVATDSFRLIEKTVPEQGFVLAEPLLIPFKNALELARVAETKDTDVTFYIDENQCALEVDTVYITSRLTTGTFPDYEQIIPKEYMTHTTVLTQDFAHALKKTNIFLNKFLQLMLTVDDTSLTLSSQSGDVGTTEEKISAATEGAPITLSFNQRYLSEILTHVADDSVILHFAGIGRPLVIENAHDRTMRYLVMPMNK